MGTPLYASGLYVPTHDIPPCENTGQSTTQTTDETGRMKIGSTLRRSTIVKRTRSVIKTGPVLGTGQLGFPVSPGPPDRRWSTAVRPVETLWSLRVRRTLTPRVV